MSTSLRGYCVDCGALTVVTLGSDCRWLCAPCRRRRTETADDTPGDHQTLALRHPSNDPPVAGATATPELDLPLVGEDIRRLLVEASAPIVPRSRTVGEWFSGVSAAEIDYHKKLVAGDHANALLRQRREAITEIRLLANEAATARRAQLEARLAEVELQDRIAERLATRPARLRLAVAAEAEKQRKLLAPAEPELSEREQAVQDHRDTLRARARAKRGALADFLASIRDVFESGASDEQRATEIRELLSVYRQPETVLSPKIRRFLEYVELEDER